MELSIHERMNIAEQVRCLARTLDPMIRYLPVLSGSSDDPFGNKHNLIHNNWVVQINSFQVARVGTEVKDIDGICKKIHYLCANNRMGLIVAKEIFLFSTYKNMSLFQQLDLKSLRETTHIKWAKVLLKLEISSEFETHGGLCVSPQNSIVSILKLQNRSGLFILTHMGREIVSFRMGDIRGSFTHDGPTLIQIAGNYSSKSEFKDVVRETDAFIKWKCEETRSKNYMEMLTEIRSIINARWNEFLNCLRERLSEGMS